ncbi:hypothetical protein [Microbacterium sp. P02]|uniref:hypothetical protein n=1 Tax=Microbacterium sp. P02 TaxID=3366260 RepID=UPI003671D2B3
MTPGRTPATVRTDRGDYRAALAELTNAAVRTDSPSGAIVVVDGTGRWTERALSAATSGAAALVIAEPAPVPAAALDDLRAQVGGLPVIVSRSALRPDVIEDALRGRSDAGALDILLVDAMCTVTTRPDVVRDAIGWMRAVGGGGVRMLSSAVQRGSVLAHLESVPPSGRALPCSLSLAVAAGGWRGSLLRVSGLGAVRTEVLIDSEARIRTVDTLDERGSLRAPDRFEETARGALRRALDVLAGDSSATDLADLAADARVADAVLQAVPAHK